MYTGVGWKEWPTFPLNICILYCFAQELYLLLKLSDGIVLHYLCCLEFCWKIVSLMLLLVTPFCAVVTLLTGRGATTAVSPKYGATCSAVTSPHFRCEAFATLSPVITSFSFIHIAKSWLWSKIGEVKFFTVLLFLILLQRTVANKIAPTAYIFFFTMCLKVSLEAKLYLSVCLAQEIRSGCGGVCQNPSD